MITSTLNQSNRARLKQIKRDDRRVLSPGQPETDSFRFQTGDRTSDIPGFSFGASFEEETFAAVSQHTERVGGRCKGGVGVREGRLNFGVRCIPMR